MALRIIFSLIFIGLLNSCLYDILSPENLTDAIITGFDPRACPCCGGLMINFNNEIRPYIGNYYYIDNPSTDLGITGYSTFPIYVKIKWVKLTKCNNKFIRITYFIRR